MAFTLRLKLTVVDVIVIVMHESGYSDSDVWK